VRLYNSIILHSKLTDCDAFSLIFRSPSAVDILQNAAAEQTFSHWTGSIRIAQLEKSVKEIAPINYHIRRIRIERYQNGRVVFV
jgi:hypothetical protein